MRSCQQSNKYKLFFADIYIMNSRTFMLICLCGFFSFWNLHAQAKLLYKKSGSYWMIERSDLRRYDNGKYTGLTSREVRSFVHPSDYRVGTLSNADSSFVFEGSFYIGEKTVSDFKETALSLDAAIPARFALSSSGRLTPLEDNGFPTFRSFPSFPIEAVKVGQTWTADAVRAVDPLNKGLYTRIPMRVLYTFKGDEVYKGKKTYRIHAAWATRYGRMRTDPAGDPDLVFAAGSHSADIYVLQETGQAFVIADKVDEEFGYGSGNRVQFKGSILLFTDFPPSTETAGLLPILAKTAKASVAGGTQYTEYAVTDGTSKTAQAPSSEALQSPNVNLAPVQNSAGGIEADAGGDTVIERTPAGLRLSLRNIRFLPDSTDFEPEEAERLDRIGSALKKLPSAKFLIEGHAASIGRAEGEKKLSAERARRIADELALRGIPRENCITQGHGSERPIVSNETKEGRSVNRRVEITVLE